MQIRLGMEKGLEGDGSLCWGLDFPGCFTYGSDDAEALIKFPQALLRHEAWIRLHTDSPWFTLENMDFKILESFSCYQVEELGKTCEVNACFDDDLFPLQKADITQGLLIFTWQREELLAGIETLPADFLGNQFPGERWPVNGILNHLAQSEIWYLQCLQLPVPNLQPTAPLTALENSAKWVREYLSAMQGATTRTVNMHESWTPRKFLRRLLWHQRDHISHIQRLVATHL